MVVNAGCNGNGFSSGCLCYLFLPYLMMIIFECSFIEVLLLFAALSLTRIIFLYRIIHFYPNAVFTFFTRKI